MINTATVGHLSVSMEFRNLSAPKLSAVVVIPSLAAMSVPSARPVQVLVRSSPKAWKLSTD